MSSILLVDDSPSDRALFQTLLGRAGFLVHEVARGEDAIPKAIEVRPHVVVLDVNLPGSDGFEVCRALKAEGNLAGIPVLMFTVRDRESDILAGLAAGADDYIAKDANPEIFLARVRRLVDYRQMALLTVLNEQLVQVGRLLAGVVHEIRGPLGVIKGNAEILRMQLGENPDYASRIEPILRASQLLQLRLEHLMAAVRGGPPHLEPMDLAPVVREASELFLKGIDPRGSKVAIARDLPDDLPRVQADAGRIIQVLLNLLSNSREAITSVRPAGKITITACPAERAGFNYVRIEVSDDGPGIPDAVIRRVFEPFFTTKPSGSGYGLYLTSEIVHEHHGSIDAVNLDSGGACIRIWLPRAEEAPVANS